MFSRHSDLARGTTILRSIACAASLWLAADGADGSTLAAPGCEDLGFCLITAADFLPHHLQPALRPLPAESGLERYVTFVSFRATAGFESVGEIWLARNECVGPAAEARLLADPTGATSYLDPAWSPDGRFLAYVETDVPFTSSRILVQEFGISDILSEAATPIGSPIVVVPGAPSVHNRNPAWRSDGLELAYDSDAGLSIDVYTIGLDETSNPVGSPVRRTLEDTTAEFSPAYSPDGQRLALRSNRLGPVLVHLFTFATGTVQLLDPNLDLFPNGPPAWSPDGRIVYYHAPGITSEDPRIWAFDLQTSTKHMVDTTVPGFSSGADTDVDASRHSGVSAEGRLFHSLAFDSNRRCTGPICLYPGGRPDIWRGSVCTPTVVPFPATAFSLPQDKAIRLQSDRPFWNLQIEPADGSFELIDVSLPSVVLKWAGPAGPVETQAAPGKRNVVSDQDRDGIADIAVSFRREDLRAMFSGLGGKTELSLECEGDLVTGGRFRAPFTIDVVTPSGEGEEATVYPNPLNPEATLTAWLPAGPIRVTLFDAAGRLVRTLADDSGAEAGLHEWKIDGRDAGGRSLGSGIYFFRIETAGGVRSGRFAILK